MEETGKKDNTHEEANADSQKKTAKNIAAIFLRELTSALNYLCVEHWLSSSVFILALGFIAFAIQAHFSTVAPTRWGIIGGLVIVAFVFLAAGKVIFKRPEIPLHDIVSGRSLSAVQYTQIAAAAKKWPNHKYRIFSFGQADFEAANFAREISRVLNEAGWIGDCCLYRSPGEPVEMTTGVFMLPFSKDIERASKTGEELPVDDLRKAFRVCGIVEGNILDLRFDKKTPLTIANTTEIFVGSMP